MPASPARLIDRLTPNGLDGAKRQAADAGHPKLTFFKSFWAILTRWLGPKPSL
jgi:hypothetical protein